MPIGLYPSIESSQFGSAGDLDASINAAHHSTGFAINIPPNRKQMNRELYRLDGGMNYLLQGIPEFTPGQSYGLGRLITDGTRIYKSLVNHASAAVGDLSDGTKWEIFLEKAATKSYDAAKPYAVNDTIVDPSTGDIYKCIAAALAGTPLSDATKFQKITQGNQGYDASTDTPALAGVPNGSELFVESAGTQTIGGIKYPLRVGDIIKKSNAGTYSVTRITRNLNLQNVNYNASTDTPALADLLEGGIYEVTTAGKLTSVTISGGVMVGADSYLLVGDKVLNKNGSYELISPKIKNGTTIDFGTGGLFATLKDANDYISQRVYTGVILNQLSATVETASVDVTNPCSGRLVIYGNGFTIDFSGTANTNCTLSGNNIYIDNFKVKANNTTASLFTTGIINHSNGVSAQNIHATGGALNKLTGVLKGQLSDLTLSVSAIANIAYQGGDGGSLICGAITANGGISMGNSNSNGVGGAITTGGGSFNAGNSCSNYFDGAIDYGIGIFRCGIACNNTFDSTITGNNNFICGNNTSNYFTGLVAIGTGVLNYGNSGTNNSWSGGATGTGGVNAMGGSYNNCNNQPMPAGTPASGTITAAFIRVN